MNGQEFQVGDVVYRSRCINNKYWTILCEENNVKPDGLFTIEDIFGDELRFLELDDTAYIANFTKVGPKVIDYDEDDDQCI